MTEPLFFDTDCLSAFLWVNNQSLLAKLYPGRVIIPSAVYVELSNPRIAHLKARVDTMVSSKSARVETIETGTVEYALYRKLVSKPDPGHLVIGNGEAAAIVLAKEKGGILASNNLRDVSAYVTEYGLKHVTTGAILSEALEKGLISEMVGNQLWLEMLRKRRKLGYASFTDYLNANPLKKDEPECKTESNTVKESENYEANNSSEGMDGTELIPYKNNSKE